MIASKDPSSDGHQNDANDDKVESNDQSYYEAEEEYEGGHMDEDEED